MATPQTRRHCWSLPGGYWWYHRLASIIPDGCCSPVSQRRSGAVAVPERNNAHAVYNHSRGMSAPIDSTQFHKNLKTIDCESLDV